MTWDTIQIIFWTITYLLAIIYAIKYKHHIIPWPAMFLNMSWETAALLKYRSILHIPWFLLDMALVILFLFSHHERRSNRFRLIWIFCTVLTIAVFLKLFGYNNYMLWTSFLMDLLMAILFCCMHFKKSQMINKLCFFMGLTRVCGDYAAWRYYRNDNLVWLVGWAVQVVNFLYLILISVHILKERRGR